MKVTYVQNGSLTIALIPESEIDKLILKKANGCVLHMATDTMRVLNQPLADAMILEEGMKVPLDAGGNPKALPDTAEKKISEMIDE